MGLARERLGKTILAAFAGGSNIYFCELNRTRPRVELMDEIAYPIQPQEHASDELSMVETLEAQAETVKSAIVISDGRPLAIGPITLKPRFNPHATKPGTEHAPEALPKQVDPRQASLFGAAWTLGSVKYLSEAGADSLTYYETTGWLGVMEREAGSPLPERFPSRPAMAFPMLHVFADLAELKGAELVECRSTDPLSAIGLALRDGSTLTLLLVNLTPRRQAVEVGPVDASHASIRRLAGASVRLATMEPERFRVGASDLPIDDAQVTVELDPYAVARIDATVRSQKGDA